MKSVPVGGSVAIPTGSTPRPLYARVREDAAAAARWRTWRFVQLDEYIAPPAGTESFAAALARELLDPLGVPDSQRLAFPSLEDAADLRAVGSRYDRQLESWSPLSLVILGLGHNGHVAFNEPCDAFVDGVHRVELTSDTLRRNFGAGVERLAALTIGVPQILRATRIALVVPQLEKQGGLERALTGEVTPRCPASALQEHEDFHVFRIER